MFVLRENSCLVVVVELSCGKLQVCVTDEVESLQLPQIDTLHAGNNLSLARSEEVFGHSQLGKVSTYMRARYSIPSSAGQEAEVYDTV
jgi:hypothetical protein